MDFFGLAILLVFFCLNVSIQLLLLLILLFFLLIIYFSLDTNIKSKFLQGELKGKSNFVQ